MKLYKNTVLTGAVAVMMSSAVFACDLSKITLENAYVLAGPTGQVNTAGYATIKNSGDTACDIVGAKADSIAPTVELHTITNENGMFNMQQVKSFTVPANGTLSLAQGGNHLMFLQLNKALKIDESVPVTLEFAGGEHKVENFKVKDMKG
jgi:copper(I)-binding protein